jgi:hypothetical protein
MASHEHSDQVKDRKSDRQDNPNLNHGLHQQLRLRRKLKG